MFGLGAGEIVFVVVIALVVFGPEKIPEIAKWLGKTSGELRRMSDAVRREFYNGLYVPPPEVSPQEGRKTTLVASGKAPESGAVREGDGAAAGTGGDATEKVAKEATAAVVAEAEPGSGAEGGVAHQRPPEGGQPS